MNRVLIERLRAFLDSGGHLSLWMRDGVWMSSVSRRSGGLGGNGATIEEATAAALDHWDRSEQTITDQRLRMAADDCIGRATVPAVERGR